MSSFRTSDDRPGPDSAQVATMFAALERSEPAVCEMTVDMFGNWWGGRTGRSVGRLSDVRDDGALRNAFGGRVTDPAAIRTLSASLSTDNPCVRRAAARVLGHSHSPETLAPLRSAFRSSHPRLREAGAMGLGMAEDVESHDALAAALRDDDLVVARMAA